MTTREHLIKLRDEAIDDEDSNRADAFNDAILIMDGKEPGSGWAA